MVTVDGSGCAKQAAAGIIPFGTYAKWELNMASYRQGEKT